MGRERETHVPCHARNREKYSLPRWRTLANAATFDRSVGDELGLTLQRLAPRWFVVRNAHATSPAILMQPRYAMSLLRGPMTRGEIRAARSVTKTTEAASAENTKAAQGEPWTSNASVKPREHLI